MDEEVDCLAAIYGHENVEYDSGAKIVKISMEKADIIITLTLQLNESYPDTCPDKVSIRFQPSISTELVSKAEAYVRSGLENCLGDSYLMNAVVALQDYVADHVMKVTEEENENVHDEVLKQKPQPRKNWIVVLKLDHMRNRQKYLKHLKKWSNELRVRVSVFVLRSVKYVIVLDGEKTDVDRFIVNWKTQCVDVDSKGKPCKEKLMTICKSESGGQSNRSVDGPADFTLLESDDVADFVRQFETLCIQDEIRTLFA